MAPDAASENARRKGKCKQEHYAAATADLRWRKALRVDRDASSRSAGEALPWWYRGYMGESGEVEEMEGEESGKRHEVSRSSAVERWVGLRIIALGSEIRVLEYTYTP